MNESDPRASRSRIALLNAGINVLNRNPDASLSEIAINAGVGRATLYRHFATREQLLVEVANESLLETERACAHILKQNIKGRLAIEEIFRSVMPLANQFHFIVSLWSVVEKDKKLKKTCDRLISRLVERIEEAKKEMCIDKTLPNDWLVSVLDNLLYTGWVYVGSGVMPVKRATELAITTFFNGAGKSK